MHAWVVSLNFYNSKFIQGRANLYVVNKEGITCLKDPPYVTYYKWLCSSRAEVRDNLTDLLIEIISKYEVDGVHLDYIRFPDVILPKALRSKYEGVPSEEIILPKFDYCYCAVCRDGFEKDFGVNPMKLRILEPAYGKWFGWRARKITELVKFVYRKVKNMT